MLTAASDVVTVDVLPDFWADAGLPLLAILISVGTLVWTMVDRRRDGARIQVRAYRSLLIDGTQTVERIVIEATNVGRAGSTSVTWIGFKVGRRGGRVHSFPGLIAAPLPRRLEPGESVSLDVNPAHLASTCFEKRIRPRHLRPLVRTGHGEFEGRLGKGARSLTEGKIGLLRRMLSE